MEEVIEVKVVWLDGTVDMFAGLKNSDGDYGYDSVKFETPDGKLVEINKRATRYIVIS